MRVYLLTVDGCDACAKAKRVMTAFKTKWPRIPVIVKNLTSEPWDPYELAVGFSASPVGQPSAAPSYAVITDDHKLKTYTKTVLTLSQLENWLGL